MHHHPDKRAHDYRRIDLDESSFALSFANVTAEKVVDAKNKLVKKHLRQLVLLERGVKQ